MLGIGMLYRNRLPLPDPLQVYSVCMVTILNTMVEVQWIFTGHRNVLHRQH